MRFDVASNARTGFKEDISWIRKQEHQTKLVHFLNIKFLAISGPPTREELDFFDIVGGSLREIGPDFPPPPVHQSLSDFVLERTNLSEQKQETFYFEYYVRSPYSHEVIYKFTRFHYREMRTHLRTTTVPIPCTAPHFGFAAFIENILRGVYPTATTIKATSYAHGQKCMTKLIKSKTKENMMLGKYF